MFSYPESTADPPPTHRIAKRLYACGFQYGQFPNAGPDNEKAAGRQCAPPPFHSVLIQLPEEAASRFASRLLRTTSMMIGSSEISTITKIPGSRYLSILLPIVSPSL
ncbi:hypothetical protein ABIA38_000671 [Embleya sp. AB8]